MTRIPKQSMPVERDKIYTGQGVHAARETNISPNFLSLTSQKTTPPTLIPRDGCETIRDEHGGLQHCCCESHWGGNVVTCGCLTILRPPA